MGTKVLIVEDSLVFQNGVKDGLSEYGYDVQISSSIKEAKDLLLKSSFDFIILDLNLPDGSGETIIAETRGKPGTRIVVLTSSESSEIRAKLFMHGVCDYFSKENRLDNIVENIHLLMQDVLFTNPKLSIMVHGNTPVVVPLLKALKIRNYPFAHYTEADDVLNTIDGFQLMVIVLKLYDKQTSDLVREIRSKLSSIDLPIIIISESQTPDQIAFSLKAGVNDFMSWPCPIEQFLLKVQQLTKVSWLNNDLKKQEKKLRLLADNSTDLIFQYDAKGKIEYASMSSKQILNIDPEELLGQNIHDYLHEDDKEAFWIQSRRWSDSKEIKSITCRFKKGDGNYIWMESALRPITSKDGKMVVAIQGGFRDISLRKHLEDELLERSRTSAMSEIITTLSHQWRQPITRLGMLVNNLQLDIQMGEGNTDASLNKIARINGEIQSLSKMIDSFRDTFTKENTKQAVKLREVVELALSSIAQEAKSIGVSIVFKPNDQSMVMINKTEVMQVVHGIIKNSLEALVSNKTQNPKIEIVSTDSGEASKVLIKDNGGGIPKETLKKLFEPYSSTKGNIGSGIGLYLARIIVENRNEGSLNGSNVSNGALFEIIFPSIKG